jgi:phage/plasmid-associated DNA primase
VEGAVKYLGSSAKDPLEMCTAVREAAEQYRKNEDRIGLFLEERTITSEGTSLAIRDLYGIYKGWTESRTERPLSQTNFQRRLSDRGIKIEGQGSNAMILGYILRPMAVPDNTQPNWGALTLAAKNI